MTPAQYMNTLQVQNTETYIKTYLEAAQADSADAFHEIVNLTQAKRHINSELVKSYQTLITKTIDILQSAEKLLNQ